MAPPGNTPASILIVDDDEAVTQTFARMLRMEGFEVRTAVNAESGLADASEHHPDAIILKGHSVRRRFDPQSLSGLQYAHSL